MATPLTNVRLAPETVAKLDKLAAKRGKTRSDLIREAIAAMFERERRGTAA